VTFTIYGSHGTLTIDDHGTIIARNNDPHSDENYDFIERFDVDEYRKYAGKLEDTDILLIGYWCHDGAYEPAEEEHRNLIAQGEQSITLPPAAKQLFEGGA